jgi:hypothetical protein
MTTLEDKTVKELLALLETAAPTVTAELRDRLKNLERAIYSEGMLVGYSEGVTDGEARATVPDKEHFLRGEAKGLKWAYYAASGGQVAPNENPFVGPTLINKLLDLGKKNKK